MKRKICLILSCILVLSLIMTTAVSASDISTYNNHTMVTYTSFIIRDSGEAIVTYQFIGYKDITAGAVMSIKIEKRNLLFFWNEIVDDYFVVAGESGDGCNIYQLTSKGTYRCTVTYRVSGTTGVDDLITFEDTKTY